MRDDACVVRTPPHRCRPGRRHRRAHRRPRTGRAGLRRHGVRAPAGRTHRDRPRAGGQSSTRQARRSRRLPVLHRGHARRKPRRAASVPAAPGPALPSETAGCGRAWLPFLPGVLPAHLGHVRSASRSTNASTTRAARSAGHRPPVRSWTTSGESSPRAPRWTASHRWCFRARRLEVRPSSSVWSDSSPGWASRRLTSRPSSAGWLRYLVTSPIRRARGAAEPCPPTTSSSDATVRAKLPRIPTRRASTRYCGRCQGCWPRSTRVGATPAPTSPPTSSFSCRWTAATTRPTVSSTVPPPRLGSITGIAASSNWGCASSPRPPRPSNPPSSTRTSHRICEPECSSRWPTAPG